MSPTKRLPGSRLLLTPTPRLRKGQREASSCALCQARLAARTTDLKCDLPSGATYRASVSSEVCCACVGLDVIVGLVSFSLEDIEVPLALSKHLVLLLDLYAAAPLYFLLLLLQRVEDHIGRIVLLAFDRISTFLCAFSGLPFEHQTSIHVVDVLFLLYR